VVVNVVNIEGHWVLPRSTPERVDRTSRGSLSEFTKERHFPAADPFHMLVGMEHK
jgi:hypothetical protein